MNQTVTAPPAQFAPGSLERQLATVCIVTFLADWLFIGHSLGISCAVFAATVCAACAASNPLSDSRALIIGCAVAVVGVVPLVEAVGAISVAIAVIATLVFALIVTGQQGAGSADFSRRAAQMLYAAPYRLVLDVALFRRLMRRSRRTGPRVAFASAWLVPVLFGLAFAALFTSANPLIEAWIKELDLGGGPDGITFYRVVFWLIISSAVWPAIRVRYHKPKLHRYEPPGPHAEIPREQLIAARKGSAPGGEMEFLFNPASVLRSLVLFNALFAVQTGLDIAFLWGDATLPDGMAYADYAHRGAYTLIAAAVLSAVFVLIALRPGSETERMPAIRGLVYVWVAQNVLLVASAMQRLDLYIEVYALTQWRVAALIWMALVAVGLLLIVLRIALNKSNSWLVATNLTAVLLVLYASSLVNFSQIIASYNVAHSREMSGQGVGLDVHYLQGLGAMALPAIDRFIERRRSQGDPLVPALKISRTRLVKKHMAKVSSGWRAWSYRDWRLVRYLEDRQVDTLGDESELSGPRDAAGDAR